MDRLRSMLEGKPEEADAMTTEDSTMVVSNMADPKDCARFVTLNGRAESVAFRNAWTQLWMPNDYDLKATLVDASGSAGNKGTYVLTLTEENLTFNETGHTAPGRESAQLILVNPEGKFASYEEYSDTAQLGRLVATGPCNEKSRDSAPGPSGGIPSVSEVIKTAKSLYQLFGEGRMGEAVQLIHEECVFSIPDYTDPARITSYRLMHNVEEWLAFYRQWTAKFFEISKQEVIYQVVDGFGAGGDTGVLVFTGARATFRNKDTGGEVEGIREGHLTRFIETDGTIKMASFKLFSDTGALERLALGASTSTNTQTP
eukprot:CAMPEP_0206135690 /NCGR_PEP_ID=MMETSP1473-20131121/953_1 /ASSEMBLY_ACC=CAM_ASM_001109 /TAXON_ID=1461547 /ORGANISM="Stichococcus sp, Strain RCC1054" /LENGTH=314 /DNA_ID=CAMNT_0053527707 /DNA_START=583 /DNA_END=1527 /DNA_ORIENTATION=-